MAPRTHSGLEIENSMPPATYRRNPKGSEPCNLRRTCIPRGYGVEHSTRSAAGVLLGSYFARLAEIARPRLRAIAALLLLDGPHRERLRRRALRSHHNTPAHDPL